MKLIILILMFVYLLQNVSTSNTTLIAFTGTLSSFMNCTTASNHNGTSITDFKTCSAICGANNSCQLCVFKNSTCRFCGRIAAQEAYRTDDESGYPIGLKISDASKNYTETCNLLPSSPITTTTTQPTTSKFTCPSGFKTFQREPFTWCMKSFYHVSLSSTYTNANNLCAQHNMTISGLNSLEERNYVRDSFFSFFTDYVGTQSVWIDGTRKPECSGTDWKSFSSCNGMKGFSFTDPTLTSFDGYVWADGEPNGDAYDGTPQRCIQMVLPKSSTVAGFGKLDDIGCNTGGAGILAVICGQEASMISF